MASKPVCGWYSAKKENIMLLTKSDRYRSSMDEHERYQKINFYGFVIRRRKNFASFFEKNLIHLEDYRG